MTASKRNNSRWRASAAGEEDAVVREAEARTSGSGWRHRRGRTRGRRGRGEGRTRGGSATQRVRHVGGGCDEPAAPSDEVEGWRGEFGGGGRGEGRRAQEDEAKD